MKSKYELALYKLGPNGTILKINGEPYSVVDRNDRLQVNVRLSDGSGRATFQVKNLVLFASGVPFDSRRHKIIHIDGDYRNCRLENLRVLHRTQPEKRKHA